MANDALTAACSSNRDVPNSQPSALQDCSDIIHISIFFDGTGNNKDADETTKSWSNVARMWRAALLTPQNTTTAYPIYISGVGTQFNGQAANRWDRANIWVEDTVLGGFAGRGGDRRLEFGADNVNARLREALIANADRLGGEVAAYAKANSSKSFGELNQALGRHRLIKVINVSVIGFSRGAALARAFVNRLVTDCERRGGELHYQGYPLRVAFLGLFDTVASFGLPAQNVRLPFQERELIVPRDVERCVHYVAAHELRFSFPVDLITQGGQLPSGWAEVLYPGVHSDIGGGYEPVNQGITNNYSRVPMRDMMREAVLHGVRIPSYTDVKAINFPLFTERFECLASTESAYRGYMAAVGGASGGIRAGRIAHMKALYSAYGTMHRAGIETPGERARADSTLGYKYIGPKGMAWEVAKYRAASRAGQLMVRFGDAANVYAQYVKPQDWQLAAWDSPASDRVVSFVRDYVHDSKVDFVGNIEPFSYFRLRTMQESTRSVWNETGDWIAARTEQAADAAQRTARRVQHTAEEVAAEAQARAEQAKAAAERAYARARAKAAEAYDAAKHTTREAYEAGKREAQEAYESAKAAAAVAEREAQQALQEGRRIVEQGVTWVEKQLDSAGKAVESATQGVRRRVGL